MRKIAFYENLSAQSQKNNTIAVYNIYARVLFRDDSEQPTAHRE